MVQVILLPCIKHYPRECYTTHTTVNRKIGYEIWRSKYYESITLQQYTSKVIICYINYKKTYQDVAAFLYDFQNPVA